MLTDQLAGPPEPTGVVEDERLRLLAEIAHAFLVQEATVAQRITRAKAKVKAAGVPWRVPGEDDLPARVDGVLTVLYLVYNEGYLASGVDADPVRADLTGEAIRLTRLVRALLPDDGEVVGPLALMLLTAARRAARVSSNGELVTLDQQDRGAWDHELVAEGHALVRDRIASGRAPGRYQVLAAINAVHTDAVDARATDWPQVVALYDHLARLDPSPVVALNRAIAVAELDGPQVALAQVEPLAERLAGYHAFHATRADLLRRLGRSAEARAAYDRAIGLARNSAEMAYLTRRRDELAAAGRG
jgi:RNA polymerase sigma-70 factor (ECF subfamily)